MSSPSLRSSGLSWQRSEFCVHMYYQLLLPATLIQKKDCTTSSQERSTRTSTGRAWSKARLAIFFGFSSRKRWCLWRAKNCRLQGLASGFPSSTLIQCQPLYSGTDCTIEQRRWLTWVYCIWSQRPPIFPHDPVPEDANSTSWACWQSKEAMNSPISYQLSSRILSPTRSFSAN